MTWNTFVLSGTSSAIWSHRSPMPFGTWLRADSSCFCWCCVQTPAAEVVGFELGGGPCDIISVRSIAFVAGFARCLMTADVSISRDNGVCSSWDAFIFVVSDLWWSRCSTSCKSLSFSRSVGSSMTWWSADEGRADAVMPCTDGSTDRATCIFTCRDIAVTYTHTHSTISVTAIPGKAKTGSCYLPWFYFFVSSETGTNLLHLIWQHSVVFLGSLAGIYVYLYYYNYDLSPYIYNICPNS